MFCSLVFLYCSKYVLTFFSYFRCFCAWYYVYEFLCVDSGFYFFSSRRRHTRCALVTGVQTCALPIFGCRIVHEIHLEDRDPLDRLAGEQVDAGDARAGVRLPHHLRPAARRDPQIDHRARLFQKAEFLVEFDQLVGGARPITLGLRAPDIGVVELSLQPARRRCGAPPRRLHPFVQPAAAAARSLGAAALAPDPRRYIRRLTCTVPP